MPTFFETKYKLRSVQRGPINSDNSEANMSVTAHAKISVEHPLFESSPIEIVTRRPELDDSDLAQAVLQAFAVFAHDLADATKEHLPPSPQPKVESD